MAMNWFCCKKLLLSSAWQDNSLLMGLYGRSQAQTTQWQGINKLALSLVVKNPTH